METFNMGGCGGIGIVSSLPGTLAASDDFDRAPDVAALPPRSYGVHYLLFCVSLSRRAPTPEGSPVRPRTKPDDQGLLV
ncbi:hypothetical protein GCM10027273_04340 [Nocardioides pakistanensis]